MKNLGLDIDALIARVVRGDREDGDLYKLGSLLKAYYQMNGVYHPYSVHFPDLVKSCVPASELGDY